MKVVNGFVDNNVCFEAILISHPKFYRRNLGWDEINKPIKICIKSMSSQKNSDWNLFFLHSMHYLPLILYQRFN